MSLLEWECSRCTYKHTVPGTRCVMCDQLRVTKEQMHDFVLGKALPKKRSVTDNYNDDATVLTKTTADSTGTTTPKENLPPPAKRATTADVATMALPKPPPVSNTAPVIRNPYNPYDKPKPAASTKPSPSNEMQTALPTLQHGRLVSGTTSNRAIETTSVDRTMQQQQPSPYSHSTSSLNAQGVAAATVNGHVGHNATEINSMAASMPPATGSVGTVGPLPTTNSHPQPALPINHPRPVPQSSVPAANIATTTTTTAHPPIQKPSAPSDKQAKLNPFELAKRRPNPAMAYVPGPVPLCTDTASDWIYPVHESYPVRDYQLDISKTAILHNTLVSLPTGLGKTLIASVVLYNFYRWFPSGKVIFLAPTLPLVNQQVKACYDIMGIPTQDTALLTGKVVAKEREGLWKARRVFFCTPQTVQRDIESEKCPARQVVCVVLDEAHKASGAYAYVRVVQQLEEAGAKFRVLGLSATPGTGIKQIQEVVTALRIQKIEARLEDDPSVKKYIHERHSEIVVVKQASAVTTIERLLNDLISPVLERLRANNGFLMIRGSNATLTPYCILRAQRDYSARPGRDKSLNAFFFAAHSLVQLRAEIRRTGIGMVRTKMIQMKNQSTGLLSKIVQEKEFQTVFDAVLRASSDPNNLTELAQDRKLNNPKLMKLDEILTEHFERARASEKSSRAIVFTQWRDSVSEIVAVLASNQPLLRARHFVGQGKSSGGANKERVNQSCASLKGMKQKEQQAVIREFREGKYNILVCTCIGEEGLDIGEVDLIVNYDSLSSPIRMIQRVGRTGRKRDGRVVCLVSEGAEEHTMRKSKTAERTLGRALKKPDSFNVVRSPPMLPQAPVLRQLDMTVAREFRMSQVGGNGLAVKSRSDELGDASNTKINSPDWRLSAAQEIRRETLFGDLVSFTCPELWSYDGQLPQALRKRILRARTRSMSSHGRRKKRIPPSFGASRRVLLRIEKAYGTQNDDRLLLNTGMNTAKSRRESGALQRLFPLERSSEKDRLDRGLLKMSLSAPAEESTCLISKSTSPSQLHKPTTQEKQDDATGPSALDSMTVGNAKPQNPYRRRNENAGGLSLPQVQGTATPQAQIPVTENVCAKDVPTVPDLPVNVDEFRLPTQSSSSSSSEEGSDSDDEGSEQGGAGRHSGPPQQENVERESNLDIPTKLLPKAANGTQEQARNLATKEAPVRVDQKVQDETFRLPTQDSSSEDDESTEEGSGDEKSSSPVRSEAPFRPPDEINVAVVGKQESFHCVASKEEDVLSLNESQGLHIQESLVIQNERSWNLEAPETDSTRPSQILVNTPKPSERTAGASNQKRLSPAAASTTATTLPLARSSPGDGGSDLVDTPNSVHTPSAPCASAASGADLVDTPQYHEDAATAKMLPPPARSMLSPDSHDGADDIVCAVCFGGHSPDDNPIVLCDGPNNDHSCPIAVHKLCYSISAPLEDTDSWQCDVCAFRQHRPASKHPMIRCFVCQKKDGPLKQMQNFAGQTWIHSSCRHAVVDRKESCQFCPEKGATRCASEGCKEYVHPHCGLKSEDHWIVVAYATSESTPSSLGSDDVIGCNVYCRQHRERVRRSLAPIGDNVAQSRYFIVPSKLRDNNRGIASTKTAQRKRLRKKPNDIATNEGIPLASSEQAKSTDETIDSVDKREEKRQRVLERMKERQSGMQRCRFLDLEVDIDSDQGPDDDFAEEDDARRIEEEEAFHKEFINDSSQLGYTQDDLDRLGLTDNSESQAESGAVHRRVDVMKERMNQFATPIFNRRMRQQGGRGQENAEGPLNAWDGPTPQSAPSSQKGLGNMNFIRSVLEHHRNGGEADDIEKMYHRVAQDQPTPNGNPAGATAFDYEPSDSEDSGDDEQAPTSHNGMSRLSRVASGGAQQDAPQGVQRAVAPALTAEQVARIERNRQEALKKRQRTQSQM